MWRPTAPSRATRQAVTEKIAEALDTMLRDTPRLGLLDSSNQAADQTVEEIIRRADEALVRSI